MSKHRNIDIDKEVRNVNFTLNPKRMSLYKKLLLSSVLTLFLMLVYESKIHGLYRDYYYIESLVFLLVFLFFTIFVEYVDFLLATRYFFGTKKSVMIGYSNLVTIYDGVYPDSNLISRVYSADKIRIRKVLDADLDSFYPFGTSVIECYTKGEVHTKIGVKRVKKYEGIELYPNSEKDYLDIFSMVSCKDDCDNCSRRAFCDDCNGTCNICNYRVLCERCDGDCMTCDYVDFCDTCEGTCDECIHKKDCISCYDSCKIDGSDEKCRYFDECPHRNFWNSYLEEKKDRDEKDNSDINNIDDM